MAGYGQQVRDLLQQMLTPQLGMQARVDKLGYENDLGKIAKRVDDVFGEQERLRERMEVLYYGLIASFGALARTWCDHATAATAYQNAHGFATALRPLLEQFFAERTSGRRQP